jgi:hypothetical protein
MEKSASLAAEASNGSYAIVGRNGDVKSQPEPLILN